MKNPHPDPTKHGAIPIWNAENWHYEDIIPGHALRSIRRTISEGESMQFNTLVMDLHPYVADEIFAKKEGVFGQRLVAGAFVFSLGLGLVATNCVNAFSYGYDKLRFIKPVATRSTPSRPISIRPPSIPPSASCARATRYSKTKANSCSTVSICKP
jgi:hypothetical protein